MAITVTVTPGKQFGSTEAVDIDGLNALGQPTFAITGTVAATDMADGAVTAQKQTIDRAFYGTGSFSAGVYTVTFAAPQSNGPASHVEGLIVAFKADADNTGATDIDIDDLSDPKNLFKNRDEELEIGDIVTGDIVHARYDGTNYQLLTKKNLPEVWTAATSAGTPPNWTATITPPTGVNAITYTELQGRPIYLRWGGDSVGSDTLTLTIGTTELTPAKTIHKFYNQVLSTQDIKQNQEVVLVYNSTTDSFQMVSPPASSLTPLPITGDSRNLIIENDSATPNSIIDITYDEVILTKGTGANAIPIKFTSGTFSIDLGTTGLNGHETGVTTSANRWYYVWLISDGTSIKGVLEDSITDPPGPPSAPDLSGTPTFDAYRDEYSALVGAIRTDGSSNLLRFYQLDRRIWLNPIAVPASGSLTTKTSWSVLVTPDVEEFRKAIPPIAKTISGLIGATGASDVVETLLAACDVDGNADASNHIGKTGLLMDGGTGTLTGLERAASYNDLPVRGGNANYNIQYIQTSGTNNTLEIASFTI